MVSKLNWLKINDEILKILSTMAFLSIWIFIPVLSYFRSFFCIGFHLNYVLFFNLHLNNVLFFNRSIFFLIFTHIYLCTLLINVICALFLIKIPIVLFFYSSHPNTGRSTFSSRVKLLFTQSPPNLPPNTLPFLCEN